MGKTVLRQLEGNPEMAAAQTLREVFRDRRTELERDHGVLRGRGEVLLGNYRGRQYRDLKWSHSTHWTTR